MGKRNDAKPAPKAKGKAKEAVKSQRMKDAEKSQAVHGDCAFGRPAVLDACSVTGVLASRELARDVRLEQVTVSLYGRELIQDAVVQLNCGRRYGLIGSNGSGKSTLLAAIAARELPIPEHIDIWFLYQEAAPSDTTALDAVVDVARKEYERLEALSLKLCEDPEGNAEILEAVGDKLDKMDPGLFEARAGELLFGLGFSTTMSARATKDMSGGWRMRVALAQALFKQPTLLILDEPTNHLDLGACVWLEEYLAAYPSTSTICMTSHSEDFMDGVCTEIMQLTVDQKLVYWGGNYSQYVQTRKEKEVNQLTAHKKEQDDIKHLQEFIRSCGTYANMRRQADSKQKIIDKMVEKGLTEKPKEDPKYHFVFPNSEKLAPPILAFNNVSFSYSGNKEDYLYTKLSFGVDLDSRIALVGPNGAGKSTLLKLMRAELECCEGEIKRHNHLRLGVYNQHSAEILPQDKAPLEWFVEMFEKGVTTMEGTKKLEEQEWRGMLGRYGVSGDLQTRKISTFSDGLKSRICFCLIALSNPHILLLDEPTNHLDMQCIDALAEAIQKFEGGLVLVSHDFRLIDQVAKEIWVCDKKTVAPWKGDIKSYKKHLSKEMKKAEKQRQAALKK